MSLSDGKILCISDIEHLHWIASEADIPVPLVADGSGLSVAAAVELACIQAHWRRSVGDHLRTISAPGCSAWSLLKRSGWPTNGSRATYRDGAITAVVLQAGANDIWWTRCLRELLGELGKNRFPVRLARALTGAVAEMVDNVWQHSEGLEPGILVYEIRPRKFAFSVADTGVGVLASLRGNLRYKWLDSSMDAIQLAIRPGVSRSDTGGTGFPSMLHAIADLWGNARFRTGESSLLIDRTTEQRRIAHSYLPDLPGLHVSVRCALTPPSLRQV